MAQVYGLLDRSRSAWRMLDLLGGLLRTFVVFGGALVVGFLADNLLHLPGPVRLVYGVGLVVLLAGMTARLVIYPLLRPISDEMVAAHVERAVPELDNRVINAVLLAEERFRDSLTRRLAAAQIGETADCVRARRFGAPARRGTFRRPAWWALGLAAFALLYGLLFSEHFGNAFARFLHPTRYVPPITATRLTVVPGDAEMLQGDSLAVEARVSGLLPETARVECRGGKGASSDAMAFEGNAFTYTFVNVQEDFTYRIRAGDALTRRYVVTVRDRPAVKRLGLTYLYPAYTGMPERTEADGTGDVRAPVGTTLRLDVQADRPVAQGRIEFLPLAPEGAAPQTSALLPLSDTEFRGELAVGRSGTYRIHLEDAGGIANIPRARRLEALPDTPPRVVFEEPARDVAVTPDARVALLAGVEDDFSLRELRLRVQRSAGANWESLRTWTYEPGTRTAREGALLDVRELGLKTGDVLAYYMQANDGLRHDQQDAGRSRTYRVRIVDARTAVTSDAETEQALRDVVRRLITLQQGNLDATLALAGWAAGREELATGEQDAWGEFRTRAARLVTAQEGIWQLATDAVSAQAGRGSTRMAEALGRIAAAHLAAAVGLLKNLEAIPDAEALPARSQSAEARQRYAIELLRELLDDPAGALARILAEQGESERLGEKPEDLTDAKQLAERLLKSLDEFQEDQKRLVELSNQLAEKPVEDFTDEDEGRLKDIIDAERDWARFFQEAATDLSKLPPQDQSLATQAKEFLEVYSEIQQAVEAAERQAIEMAVPYEQSGLELAESIETNIEKWLMETKDRKQWSMEDPLEDYELPLTELPDELQDLIGDLVESEEDLLEKYDDMTSGWSDSLDVGAGWDTTDGPISNMSAKGITGNRLPNTNEVGGRSGEGRTGKSSGQFVEEEATGKGGRATPSRLTADPFEAGWVKDSSGDAPTGATGGGKVSGQGAEGFQGATPPPLQQALKRMANQQAEIIDKARRLDYGLKKYRQPRGSLPEAIELMEAQKTALQSGEVRNFAHYQRIVLSNLREVKELSEKQKQLVRDRSALLPKELRDEVAAAQDEPVPEQYREMVRNYFRALSDAGTARR